MDNICIKTNKLRQLEQIGKLSAKHLTESEEYIKLAMNVEHFVKTESTEVLELIKKQLAMCINGFQDFNQTKNNLMAELLNIGYLSTTEQSKPDNVVEQSPITTPTPLINTDIVDQKTPKSNVISIFKNKK